MANQEQVQMLINSVEEWNQWRLRNNTVFPDLIDADLRHSNLSSANLSGAMLIYSNLNYANLSYIDLNNTHLSLTNLSGADLSHAILCYADLIGTNLSGANFSGADLRHATLRYADLSHVNLYHADLSAAIIEDVRLNDLDLQGVIGLEQVVHSGPSDIGTRTLERSRGVIPESFLRGVGLSYVWILRSWILACSGQPTYADNDILAISPNGKTMTPIRRVLHVCCVISINHRLLKNK